MKTFYDNDIITPVIQQHITESQSKGEEGKDIKNQYLSFLLFFGILILLFAVPGYLDLRSGDTFSATIWLSITAILLLLLSAGLISTIAQHRVAMLMKTQMSTLQQIPATEIITPPQVAKPIKIPPFQLDVYEQNELSSHTYTLNANLTEERNIFNYKPLQIFYFFNFYSSYSLQHKLTGGWQRHGPVSYLGSPADISYGKFWNLFKLKKIVNELLITSPEKLSVAIDRISGKPLPPKTKGLLTENYFTGAYPANVFLCTDTIWQQCVALLFNRTDFAIIDACDYTTERAGLQWEIGQIINHIATENFVVIINNKTDIVALGESFRNAWKQMQSTSPNNKDNAAPLRFIFYQKPDRVMAEPKHKNVLYESARQQALSDDRIIAFILQSKEAGTSVNNRFHHQ